MQVTQWVNSKAKLPLHIPCRHLLTHALFKALFFICAGGVIRSIGDDQDISFIGGLSNFMGGLSNFMGSLSLLYLPLLVV
jgi:NADH:ubiquinone oxidoreductase subunit 5 (subunit L)/multisubunit Na+/H+ antiporter MnhA subunit